MPFSQHLNTRVQLYNLSHAAGQAEPTYTTDGHTIDVRIVPSSGVLGEDEIGLTIPPSHKLMARFEDFALLNAATVLKVVAVRYRTTGWQDVSDGDEYIAAGRPENVAGANHHLHLAVVRGDDGVYL